MKTFIFLILIPIVAGIVSGINGISVFDSETIGLYAAINIPICTVSVLINALVD